MQYYFTSEELVGEIWRPVFEYEGIYEVSSLGRIKRILQRQGVAAGYIQNPRIDKHGYARVSLKDRGRDQLAKVHQVVAQVFLPPKPTLKHQINHIDNNRWNNKIQNIEWVTNQENQLHAYRTGNRISTLRGEGSWAAKLKEFQVFEIRASQDTNEILAQRYGVASITIYQIRKGQKWKHLL